jgi:hypothetical protein
MHDFLHISIIECSAADEADFVSKLGNWAIVEIGQKRNDDLDFGLPLYFSFFLIRQDLWGHVVQMNTCCTFPRGPHKPHRHSSTSSNGCTHVSNIPDIIDECIY